MLDTVQLRKRNRDDNLIIQRINVVIEHSSPQCDG